MSSAKLSLRGHFLFSLIMAAKQERFNIWKQLKPPELRRLAFAVLLIFAIMGPIQVLMLPTLKANFWFRWVLVTFISGGFGLFYDMKLIGEMNSIDVALLPIGDNFTMGIDDAVKAVEFLNPKLSIPIHKCRASTTTPAKTRLEKGS